MTTIAPAPSTPARAASSTIAVGAIRSDTRRLLAFAGATLRSILTDVSFLVFTIALPVTMYLVFSGIYGDIPSEGGIPVKGVMMVTMAAYGGLGAAMNVGFSMQTQIRNGWLRQLTLAGLPPLGMTVVRALVSSLTVVAAVVPVLLVAGLVKGVELPWQTWLGVVLVLWATLLPTLLLGLAIACWLPGSGGQALVMILMLLLAIVGGLWFPVDFFPDWLQTLAHWTPSYWIGQLGTVVVTGADVPWRGVWTLTGWTVAFVVAAAFGYRHAVRSTR